MITGSQSVTDYQVSSELDASLVWNPSMFVHEYLQVNHVQPGKELFQPQIIGDLRSDVWPTKVKVKKLLSLQSCSLLGLSFSFSVTRGWMFCLLFRWLMLKNEKPIDSEWWVSFCMRKTSARDSETTRNKKYPIPVRCKYLYSCNLYPHINRTLIFNSLSPYLSLL